MTNIARAGLQLPAKGNPTLRPSPGSQTNHTKPLFSKSLSPKEFKSHQPNSTKVSSKQTVIAALRSEARAGNDLSHRQG